AVEAGADAILIDNQAPNELRKLVEMARSMNPNILIEASGGITLENVRSYAETGVDLISVGKLTHSARAVDISFKIQPLW
ncbi:MAG: nicotinate-nucleotide diphosphorylase, partial [Pyrinomonadaceae bacterium]